MDIDMHVISWECSIEKAMMQFFPPTYNTASIIKKKKIKSGVHNTPLFSAWAQALGHTAP